FKKPERPPTPDHEWNEGKSAENKPTQRCLSDLAKISDLTQDILVGLTYELLKGTCMSYVELDYNMEECYKALTGQLDWNNPKGDRYPFDLSKPLPLGNVTLGSQRQSFYGYASNRVSKHVVYSTKRILAVTKVKVKEWYGYGHLKEIETLQPQSYHKKLNIFRPITHKAGITDLTPYSAYSNRKGFIYVDKLGRNRLMCSHELYKYSDGTLISLHHTLNDIAKNLEMAYTSVMPRRRWSNLDKKRSRIMIKDIDPQLLDIRLMRSLEKFVGGRYYGEDPRLLQRTI
ncbi:hypothetical protein Tco_0896048, partial [Tanacetum coccineum]